MLITFFPCLWHGMCAAVHRRDAEDAENDRNWGTLLRPPGYGGQAGKQKTARKFNAAQPKVPAGRAPFLTWGGRRGGRGIADFGPGFVPARRDYAAASCGLRIERQAAGGAAGGG